MTTEESSEEVQESGGALREKLEAANAETRALREALVKEVTGSFQHVSESDLSGVAPAELRERAAQVEAQRVQERQELLTSELKAKGWTDEQVEEFLGAPTPPSAPAQNAPTPKPRLDSSVGSPPSRPKPGEGDGLYGPSRIRAALGA